MMRAPTDEEIKHAESRLTQSRREFVASRARARVEFRNTMVKPVTLLTVAIAAGVAGYMIFRKPEVVPDDWRSRLSKLTKGWIPPRAPTAAETAATSAAATTGVMGIIIALAMKYATRQLPGIGFKLFEQAMRKRGAFGPPAQARPTVTLH